MVRVKFCGITNYEDSMNAAELGADAVGFIFAPSPRRISPERAREIINKLPPFVKSVGVFADEDPESIGKIVDICGLDMVQLHGDESPEICRKFMPRTIKSFRLKDESSLLGISSYTKTVRAVLLDAYTKGIKGGTGKTFDWSLALKAKEAGLPVILSGGLSPSNIQDAIKTVDPSFIDVSSGVEAGPGKKDPLLMKEFMEKVKNCNTRPV